MDIQTVVTILEQRLYEISVEGNLDSVKVSSQDFDEIRKFLQKAVEKFSTNNRPLDSTTLMARVQTLRNAEAKDYVLGKTSNINVSPAKSQDRGDEERRLARGFGPEKDVPLGSEQASDTDLVAQVLDDMGYINIQNNKVEVVDKESISRILKFVQISSKIAPKPSMQTPVQILNNWGKAVNKYKRVSKAERTASSEKPQGFEGAANFKKLTPNTLVFLLRAVSEQRRRKQSWDTYINPERYPEGSSNPNVAYFQYDPRRAAETLANMDIVTQDPETKKYRLNKDAIKDTVQNFLAAMDDINIFAADKSKEVTTQEYENNMEAFRELKNAFGDGIWNAAKKTVIRQIQNSNYEGAKSALAEYMQRTDKATGLDSDEEGVSAGLGKAQDTYTGRMIDVITARFIKKHILFTGHKILGKGSKEARKAEDRFRGILESDIKRLQDAYEAGRHRETR